MNSTTDHHVSLCPFSKPTVLLLHGKLHHWDLQDTFVGTLMETRHHKRSSQTTTLAPSLAARRRHMWSNCFRFRVRVRPFFQALKQNIRIRFNILNTILKSIMRNYYMVHVWVGFCMTLRGSGKPTSTFRGIAAKQDRANGHNPHRKQIEPTD